jgi:hypothetical protein
MTSEEFEEFVQRECVRILRALHHQQYNDANDRIAEMCQVAADRKQQRRRHQVIEEANREFRDGNYDLAALPCSSECEDPE